MNKDPSVSLGLSPCVLGSFRWWWCHCLGHALAERAHAIYLFSTVFHRETEGAWGLWLNSHLSLPCPLPPILPLCSPPPPSPLCLSHSDSSVGSVLLCFPFLLLPSPHLSPFSWNVTVFLHSVTPFVPLSFWHLAPFVSRWDLRSHMNQKWKEMCLLLSFS